MSTLFGVNPSEADDDDAPPAPTWQERVWAALAKPLRKHQIRQLAAATPGGTEGAADRYLDLCLRGKTVVIVGGAPGGSAVYQRVDQVPEGERPVAAPERQSGGRRRRAAVVEPEDGPLDEEQDEDDASDEEVAPKARIDRLGRVVRNEVQLGDELADEDEIEERAEAAVAPVAPARVETRMKPEGVTMATNKEKVLEALQRLGNGTAGEVAEEAGVHKATTAATLGKAARDGEVDRPSRGVFAALGAKPAKASKAAPPPSKAAPVSGDALDAAVERLRAAQAELAAAKVALLEAAGAA